MRNQTTDPPPNLVAELPHTPHGRILDHEPPQTPGQLRMVDAYGGRSPRGRGRPRGRPPGKKQAPQLATPPAAQQYAEDEMPVLSPAIRRSERVVKQKQ